MNHPPASALEFCLETVRSGRQWLIVFAGAIAAMWVHVVWLHHSVGKRLEKKMELIDKFAERLQGGRNAN